METDVTKESVTLGRFMSDAPFASTLTIVGVFAIVWLLVAGLRARRRGASTERAQWWLGATIRTLVVGGAFGYQVMVFGEYDDILRVLIQRGPGGKGFELALLFAILTPLIALVLPTGAAFLGTLASLAVGPPRGRSAAAASPPQAI